MPGIYWRKTEGFSSAFGVVCCENRSVYMTEAMRLVRERSTGNNGERETYLKPGVDSTSEDVS
jgi:hypothetical protein